MLRFFSKFVILCNVAFLVAIILRFIERDTGNKIIKLEPVENSIIVLGYGAIVFNVLLLLLITIKYAFKKTIYIHKWEIYFNLIIFIVQFFYFFF